MSDAKKFAKSAYQGVAAKLIENKYSSGNSSLLGSFSANALKSMFSNLDKWSATTFSFSFPFLSLISKSNF